MTVQCPSHMIMYMLPMMLGRTFDVQTNKAGIDIFKEDDLRHAQLNPYHNEKVESDYRTITQSSDKRDFLGISGDLALKISSGLVEVKGAGEYLRDTSNADNSIELLIRMKFQTLMEEINESAKPMDYWEDLNKDLVGTHVVTKVLYGGEVFASVKFIAHKTEYLEKIKGEVNVAFSKSGAFDVNAAGSLEKVAKNVSSMAKMDIVYFANVPLSSVPSSLQGLKELVSNFDKQVKQINEGNGVVICVGLTPLSEYTTKSKFQFNRDQRLTTALSDFNHKFDNLRQAKTTLKEFVTTLPDTYPEKDMNKLTDFSRRLNDVLKVFHETIGKLDIEKGPEQLTAAKTQFESALDCCRLDGNNRYTTRIKDLKTELAPKGDVPDVDTTSPRGLYVRWGKRGCGLKVANILYMGYIASFPERGIGGGTLYQCLPENAHMNTDLSTTQGAKGRESSLSSVRYKDLSMYPKEGKDLDGKVASCSVCQSLMRPTVRTFTAAQECPGAWTEEYKGFLASTYRSRGRTEFICLDGDADVYPTESKPDIFQAYILPAKVGSEGLDKQVWKQDNSVPCVVCSK